MQIEPDSDLLKDILVPHGDADPRYYWALLELIQEGVLTLKQDEYTGPSPHREWVESHARRSPTSGSEGSGHIELKIVASQFLQRRGHDMEKRPNPESGENEPLFTFSGFECRNETPFSADVSCTEDCCNTVVEVGYTPPRRVLDAFGFTTATDMDEDSTGPAHYELSVRHRNHSVSKLYVLPYRSGGNVYCFEPNNLPEPDMAHIANIANSVLDLD